MTERHPGGADAALRLVELAGLAPPCRIIDLGAGAGEMVRRLRALGFDAIGIDLEPGEGVVRGDILSSGFEAASFDAALSECAFFLTGDPGGALREAARLLRPGGALLYSDICPGGEARLRRAAEAAGFSVEALTDATEDWKRYYIAALWRGEAECPPQGAKNCRYLYAVLRKEKAKMDAFDRILELSKQGLYCAQIMVQLALDAQGKENPELVQAVRGLCGGFAWSGGPCGVLIGGVSFLTMLSEGLSEEEKIKLIGEYHDWFRERTAQYGGENCECILGGDRQNMYVICPGVIMDSYAKCVELLQQRGLA